MGVRKSRFALAAALLAALVTLAVPAADAPATGPARATAAAGAPASPPAELRTVHAVALGVIEGLTEFLPVSSTGHLIIAKDILGLNSNQPLFDPAGNALWHREASGTQRGQLLTLNLAADTYIVFIQFGAAAAVAMVCWADILAMLRGLCGRDPAGLRLLINLVIAFLPAAVVGLFIHDWVDENLFSLGTVIFALVAGAVLMFQVEAWYGRRYLRGERPTNELSPVGAAIIGCLQCVAIWPGTSRPMMAIVGGYLAGLDPRRSAEFSFLLGFVTVSAASVYKTYTNGAAMIKVFGWNHVLVGAIVAAVVAAVCVRYFVQLLLRHGLAVFAWYRLALAGALVFFYYL